MIQWDLDPKSDDDGLTSAVLAVSFPFFLFIFSFFFLLAIDIPMTGSRQLRIVFLNCSVGMMVTLQVY